NDVTLMEVLGWSSPVELTSGTYYVSSGQISSNLTVLNGGILNILPGGVANGAHIDSGGVQQDLGSASGTVVSAGGTEVVYPGGTDQGATVNGILLAWGGGTLNGAHI